MQIYLFIVTHPLLWVFLGLLLTFYLIMWATGLKLQNETTPKRWLRRNYVSIILGAVACLAVLALSFYLVEIGISVAALVDRLRHAAGDSETRSEDMRNLAYAVAVLVGVLAATTTVFFSSIRVWINERTATATEEGLITDRINKAVEGLGAEKTVSRVWRNVTYELDGVTHTAFEGRDAPETLPEGASNIIYGTWEVANRTTPNLEVRIGAIFALERIAQDSERDHVQIMEVLCAYVRENAPAQKNTETTSGKPRTDIQMALLVIGRRSSDRVSVERATKYRGSDNGYLLNLTNSCLDGADLAEMNFDNAKFQGAQFRGSYLRKTRFRNANFYQCDFSRAQLRKTKFQGARIWETKFSGAEIENVKLRGASLRSSNFPIKNPGDPLLRDVFLDTTFLNQEPFSSGVHQAAAERKISVSAIRDQLVEEYNLPYFKKWRDAYDAWRAWQKEIGFDPENPDW